MSDAALERLRRSWHQHVATDIAPLTALLERHREPHRRYHGVAHVTHVVDGALHLAAEVAPALTPNDVDLVVAAAFFHDAIYLPTSATNEADSAVLASHTLAALGWSAPACARVAAMIEGTAAHVDPPDTASAVLYDADLAVLGESAHVYERYRADVRAEYRHVDDESWRTGRADVLRSFLDRSQIYATPAGRQRWEVSARQNLSGELVALTT